MAEGPWRPYLWADEAADDSDKQFQITPATVVEAHVLWIWVELTTSADAGNRQLEVQIQDSAGDVIARIVPSQVQAASLTRHYLFALGMPDLLGFRDTNWLCTPLPNSLILKGGDIVRVWDNKAIAAGADDMIVQMQWAGRSIV